MRSICRKNAAAEFERIYALKESPCCADSGWPDRVPAVPSRLAMLRACLAMAAPDDAKRTGGLRVCNGAAATFRDGRLRLPASVFAEYSKPRPWSTPRRGRHRSERTSFMNRAVKGMLYRIFEATAAEHPLPGMASVSTHRFYEQAVEDVFCGILEAMAVEHPPPVAASAWTSAFNGRRAHVIAAGSACLPPHFSILRFSSSRSAPKTPLPALR